MKVLVDENLPPPLARSLNALFAGKHEITHIRERFGPGVTDLQWISELSAEGRWIIISGDRPHYEKQGGIQRVPVFQSRWFLSFEGAVQVAAHQADGAASCLVVDD